MTPTPAIRRPALTTVFQSALIMLAAVWGHRALLNLQPGAPAAAVAAAVVLALGILGIAARLQRDWWMPRWSAFAGGGVLASAVVAAAILAPGSEGGRRLEAWLFPWFLITMASSGPSPRSRACAASRPAGRIFLGTSLVLGAAYLFGAVTDFRF